jgi:uncharacterized protein (TIGR00251 family)
VRLAFHSNTKDYIKQSIMRIKVRVTTNAKKAEVIETGEARGEISEAREFKVRVNAKPVDGAANIRLIEILAEHFNVPFGAIRIISGATSREKVIEIVGN